jgi:osmotically-inducible protein OsmY
MAPLENLMIIRYGKGVWPDRLLLGAILVTLVYWPILLRADTGVAQTGDLLETIVVTAKKLTVIVPDEVLKEQVETALHDDPYFPDMHVDVRVKNGVVYLEGVVFDDSDETDAKRIIRKKAGLKRVVCDFYIPDGQ